jgi:hypothetical protein
MKLRWYILFALLYPCVGIAQTVSTPNRFFQPLTINGAAKVGGQYSYQDGTTNEIYDIVQSPVYYGGLLLNTSSYFWNPNFLTLDIGGEYNPGRNQVSYLTVPDQSEVRTLERINAAATFFKEKQFNFGFYTNYNQVYANRENLSNIRTNAFNYGGNVNFFNRILPLQVNYSHGKWDETEIQTGRTYSTEQSDLQAIIKKSFSTHDKNELEYYHNELFRKEPPGIQTQNISDNLNLKNSYSFDTDRNQSLNSFISGTDQKGTDQFKRLQVYENVHFRLPAHLDLNGNYSYTGIQRIELTSKQQNTSVMLRHRFYESLTTSLIYEYNHLYNTYYIESFHRPGVDLRYEKKIPTGRLSLSSSYFRLHQSRTSDSSLIPIINEEHVLKTGVIELLLKPHVVSGSVVVKDVTGTIIYQPNFDYLLIDRNAYIEIARVPGGQIAENAHVFVDYVVNQPGSYSYDANIVNFSASVLILKNLLEFYYHLMYQDYQNMENTEFITLNYVTQHVIGTRVEYKFASGGVEFDSYNSTVIPYRMIRAYFLLQGNIKGKVIYCLDGNYRNYRMLEDNTLQKYVDVSGNVSYMIGPQTKVTLDIGYRNQDGAGINLNLLTGRGEIVAHYNKLSFKAGVEVYKRLYLNDRINFFRVYGEIVRTFGWYKK